MTTGPLQAKLQRWWPFLLLVLAGASRWVLVAARPEAASTLASGALGCAWAALLLFVVPRGTSRAKPPLAQQRRAWLAGALLFSGPAAALLVRANGLDGGSMTIALALTPVVVAIAAAAMGAVGGDGVPGQIWPGLAVVAGLLLVLSQPGLANPRSDLALLLAPILTGTGAALFSAKSTRGRAPTRRTDRQPLSPCAALAGGAAVLAVAAALQWLTVGVRPPVTLSAVACDGWIALLSIVALSRLGATRWSAQFALLPLLVLVEGMALIRPVLSARWLVALALLALASVHLLLPSADEPEDEPALVPR